ncbi:hypothetical protein J6590_052315 [Homalodisca vitripennis]|nr:hypothetical protein J6590_052315 [Homalodisca vitripennis]
MANSDGRGPTRRVVRPHRCHLPPVVAELDQRLPGNNILIHASRACTGPVGITISNRQSLGGETADNVAPDKTVADIKTDFVLPTLLTILNEFFGNDPLQVKRLFRTGKEAKYHRFSELMFHQKSQAAFEQGGYPSHGAGAATARQDDRISPGWCPHRNRFHANAYAKSVKCSHQPCRDRRSSYFGVLPDIGLDHLLPYFGRTRARFTLRLASSRTLSTAPVSPVMLYLRDLQSRRQWHVLAIHSPCDDRYAVNVNIHSLQQLHVCQLSTAPVMTVARVSAVHSPCDDRYAVTVNIQSLQQLHVCQLSTAPVMTGHVDASRRVELLLNKRAGKKDRTRSVSIEDGAGRSHTIGQVPGNCTA